MHINLEASTHNTIQAYQDNQIQINSIIYTGSLIVSAQEIISDLAIKQIQDMDEHYLNLLIQFNPEVVLIGHNQMGKFPPPSIISRLSEQRIGVECMSLGSACRTFNVLLSEYRKVVAGFIF